MQEHHGELVEELIKLVQRGRAAFHCPVSLGTAQNSYRELLAESVVVALTSVWQKANSSWDSSPYALDLAIGGIDASQQPICSMRWVYW